MKQFLIARRWPVLARGCRPTLDYWMETEVHVYAFSIAASVLLSLFPFLLVMLSLFKYVLHWPAAVEAVSIALNDYFPEQIAEFVQRNLNARARPLQVGSMLLLMFTANGVFEPLEVALNRAWGIPKNRSFGRNQLVSLGLIFACGTLALLSAVLTAMNQQLWVKIAGQRAQITAILELAFFKMAAVPMAILILFLIYWLLPNRRIPPREVVPAAILVGLALEALKYVNLLSWPFLRAKLQKEYGPFVYSVTIILWSFIAALVVLAGAEWSARRGRVYASPPAIRAPAVEAPRIEPSPAGAPTSKALPAAAPDAPAEIARRVENRLDLH